MLNTLRILNSFQMLNVEKVIGLRDAYKCVSGREGVTHSFMGRY